MAVLCAFREPSLGHHGHRELLRNAWLDFAPSIPATACHQRNYVDSYSKSKLSNRKIGFKSITENIDTTTSGGKLVFHIFGALAEFERDIIKDRTKAGLNAARARGRLGGRPKAKMLDNPKKVALAQSLYENRDNTIDEICRTLNVSRATLYRYIKTKATEKNTPNL
jgi:DNA invertase Pin-like site-specific DNA recombinase